MVVHVTITQREGGIYLLSLGYLNHSLQIQSSVSRDAKIIYLVGQTTKQMTHNRSWDMEIGRPSCDMFNLGSSYFHVPLTTDRHLLNVWSNLIDSDDVCCCNVLLCIVPMSTCLLD